MRIVTIYAYSMCTVYTCTHIYIYICLIYINFYIRFRVNPEP